MRKFAALLKVCLSSVLLTFTGGGRGKRKRAATGVGAAALIALLALYVSGVYSFLLMKAFAPMEMERMVFLLMGAAALVSSVMFTAFGSSATVFGAKDNDLMLSMPVPTTMLLAARVTAIYLENLLFSFFLLTPAGAAYAILLPMNGGRTIAFWIRLLTAALALPLLDTTLAMIVGAAIVWISAKLPNKTLGKNLLMGAWIALVFGFSFRMSHGLESLTENSAVLESQLGWAVPIVWMTEGMMGSGVSLAKFVLLCAVAFALMTVGLGSGYRRIAAAFAATSTKSDYRFTAQRFSGQRRALLKKEARRFFGTPVYFWNSGLGLILLVALGAAALVKRAELQTMLKMPGMAEMALPIVCALLSFLLSLSSICAPSFSLEGKQIWIVRAAPVSEKVQICVKIGFQLLLETPCVLWMIACLSLALELSAEEIALLCLFSAALEGMLAAFGGWVGLWLARPEMDETAVVKRSLMSFVSMFGPMAVIGGASVLSWALCSSMGMYAVVGLTVALLIAVGAAFGVLLIKKGPERLRSMG